MSVVCIMCLFNYFKQNFLLSIHSLRVRVFSSEEHHTGSCLRWWQTQVADKSQRGSPLLSRRSARLRFWQDSGELIIGPQKCSVMLLIGCDLDSFFSASSLHLLLPSLSPKLLWEKVCDSSPYVYLVANVANAVHRCTNTICAEACLHYTVTKESWVTTDRAYLISTCSKIIHLAAGIANIIFF